MNTTAQGPANAGASPFIVEYIMVFCRDLLHMAYKDQSGKLRDAYNHIELPGPVRVLW